MIGKRKTIDDFVAMLSESIVNTVEQNISLERLSNAKRILVLQSAPISIVEEVIKQIEQVNKYAEYVILGSDNCADISCSNPQLKATYISHNKSFDGNDIDVVKRLIEEKEIDTLLYFNNFVNSVDFSNVEHVVSFVEEKVALYSYSYVQQELNKYLDITGHLYGEIAYKAIVEWFENSGEWRREE